MQLKIEGHWIQLVHTGKVMLQGDKPPKIELLPDWAIPGGGIATSGQVMDWAMANGVEVKA